MIILDFFFTDSTTEVETSFNGEEECTFTFSEDEEINLYFTV